MPGENDIGMIAWKLSFMSPEFPSGRDVILIANDITFKIGSFDTEEDQLFKKASELARKLGIPRIYLPANNSPKSSKTCSKWPGWTDEPIVTTELVVDEETKESHYKITDIMGKENGIGVENEI